MTKTLAESICKGTMGKQFLDDMEAESDSASYAESSARLLKTYGSKFKAAVDTYDSAFFLKNYGSFADDVADAIVPQGPNN